MPPGQFPIPTISSAFFLGQRGGRCGKGGLLVQTGKSGCQRSFMFLNQTSWLVTSQEHSFQRKTKRDLVDDLNCQPVPAYTLSVLQSEDLCVALSVMCKQAPSLLRKIFIRKVLFKYGSVRTNRGHRIRRRSFSKPIFFCPTCLHRASADSIGVRLDLM